MRKANKNQQFLKSLIEQEQGRKETKESVIEAASELLQKSRKIHNVEMVRQQMELDGGKKVSDTFIRNVLKNEMQLQFIF